MLVFEEAKKRIVFQFLCGFEGNKPIGKILKWEITFNSFADSRGRRRRAVLHSREGELSIPLRIRELFGMYVFSLTVR